MTGAFAASTINVRCGSPEEAGRLARACDASHAHHDVDHARAVVTIVGRPASLLARVERLCLAARSKPPKPAKGVHPSTGIVDVVPWIPVEGWSLDQAARLARAFAHWWGGFGVPVHLTGHPSYPPRWWYRAEEEEGAPRAHRATPAAGPQRPHPVMGVTLTGARGWLIPFNAWLRGGNLELAKELAKGARSLEGVEALAFHLPSRNRFMVSMNLTKPDRIGPDAVMRHLTERARAHGLEIERGEVAGMMPRSLLDAIDWDAAMTPPPRELPRPG